MKIGFDAKRAFFNFRGLGNYSRTLLHGLYHYAPENSYHLYSPHFDDVRAKDWDHAHPKMVHHYPRGILKSFPTLWRSFLLSQDLKKEDLDIYHGLSHELPPGISGLGCKSVVTIHDLIFLRHPEFFPLVDRLNYKRKFKYSAEKADRIFAICHQTKMDIINYFGTSPDKIDVVYQSCSPLFYERFSDERLEQIKDRYHIERPYILYVGALEERKNALSLVKAFNHLKNDITHNLVLIGNGSTYKDFIKDYVKKNNLGSRVFILEDVSYEDLPGFYQMADLFCYPSFFEGFGIPIIESLFSKTPVITSKGSCFPESGGDASIYVDPNSVEELTVAIKEILADEERKSQIVERGYDFVQKFHLKNTTQDLMSRYQDVLKS